MLKFFMLVGPMEDLASKLYSLVLPSIGQEVRPYFRDMSDHLHRVSIRTSARLDITSSVFDVSGLLEQQRQGVITRKLAAWAAILATPTAVAGIYGMNFDYMPELGWRWGYPGVLVLIGLICTGLLVAFKRNLWL